MTTIGFIVVGGPAILQGYGLTRTTALFIVGEGEDAYGLMRTMALLIVGEGGDAYGLRRTMALLTVG